MRHAAEVEPAARRSSRDPRSKAEPGSKPEAVARSPRGQQARGKQEASKWKQAGEKQEASKPISNSRGQARPVAHLLMSFCASSESASM
jgi:hypothetical protein